MESIDPSELEALIKTATQEGPSRPLTELERFIEENGIIPSETNKIPNYAIYDLYNKWSKQPLNREEFFKQFSNYFNRTKLGRPNQWRGYYILCPKVELNEDGKWRDYAEARKKNKKFIKGQEKAYKKKQKQVSRT